MKTQATPARRDTRTREDLRVELAAQQAFIDTLRKEVREWQEAAERRGKDAADVRKENRSLRRLVHSLELELAHTRGRMLADYGERPPVTLKSVNDHTEQHVPGDEFRAPLPQGYGAYKGDAYMVNPRDVRDGDNSKPWWARD